MQTLSMRLSQGQLMCPTHHPAPSASSSAAMPGLRYAEHTINLRQVNDCKEDMIKVDVGKARIGTTNPFMT